MQIETWAFLSMKQQENLYHTDKFLTQDCSCLKTLWGLSWCLCENNNICVLEEVAPLRFLRNIWQVNNFFRISFVSHGIALAKHMVKQDEVIFFPSDKNLNDHTILKICGRIQGQDHQLELKWDVRKGYIIIQREFYIEIYKK